MKMNIKHIVLAGAIMLGFTACKEKLSPNSIYDDIPPYDETSYTYEFDKYLYETYVLGYNIAFQYKLNDVSTDMDYNLVPVRFDKAQEVAHTVKYLFLDVYDKQMGKDFLRQYTPRILNIIGSPAVNASQGTETLGVAEGGIKITLYKMNEFDMYNMAWMNKYIFHTMHHEFSHILHQTKTFPKDYERISAGLYDSQSWQSHTDKEAYRLGFVTPYSMSEAHEDFVEVISSYITDTRETWKDRGFIMAEDHTHIEFVDEDQEGTSIINSKITMCKEWLLDKYNYQLDSIRAEVQRRQDALTYDIVMNDSYGK
jgi:substrate import-associated zinc metallohydrolase lipoprotein